MRSMRGIIWKLKRLTYKDTARSTRPAGIRKIAEFAAGWRSFREVIGVWICIEVGDNEGKIASLIERIGELNRKFYNMNCIVVMPFVHLSRGIAQPADAKALIARLVALLIKGGYDTRLVSFGTHKHTLFEVSGHPAGVSYFEF